MKQMIHALMSIFIFLLLGCNKNSGVGDLQRFTENAYKNKRAEIDPLPALKPVTAFTYGASNGPDPFSERNLGLQAIQNVEASEGEAGPDLTRTKEPLEVYPIDVLSLVGVIQKNGIAWAIIKAPDSTVYRVTEGHYLGTKHGQILQVTDNRVNVEEFVKNSVGKWERKPTRLVLPEQS